MGTPANSFRWFFNQWMNLYNWVVPTTPLPCPVATTNKAVSAAGAAATLTFAAVAGRRHTISGVHFGYADTPAAGSTLKIEDGSGTTIYQIPVTAAGAGPINFPEPIMGSENTAMIITLSAGGGTILAYLNAIGKSLEGKAPSGVQ